jgi:nicotinamide-nucleotide amidase
MKGIVERIKKVMDDKKWSLAIAESITTGNLQAQIGAVSDASSFFKGGITAYNLGQKAKHLGVDELHAKKCDCVSDQVATEMAKGVCQLFNSRIGISTTGYAEPYTDQNISDPYAYYAIWARDDTGIGKMVACEPFKFESKDRTTNQLRITEVVLEALATYLESV